MVFIVHKHLHHQTLLNLTELYKALLKLKLSNEIHNNKV